MAESLLLPIRPNGRRGPENSDLAATLRQIDVQKGAFRHVTELTLLDELHKTEAGIEEIETEDESGDEDEDESDEIPASRQEKVWKAREEMLKQLDRAKNDTLHALDFVSLLLSKDSAAARTSMSPFLQQSVPAGTLDGRVLKHVIPPLSTQRRLDAVSRGWKTKSFDAAADKTLLAGTRLHDEVIRESSFWDQVAEVKANGWAVSKLPRDSRVIGVHFGFPEATPKFRNRGFALLRRDDNGKLQMDRTSSTAGVQVALLREGKELARSSVSETFVTEALGINDQIMQARNALFEEELFYEASREGHTIANQGVLVSAGSIKFDIGDDYQVQIELVNVKERDSASTASKMDQALANSITWALRALLAYAHSQNLSRRSAAPLPLSLHPKPRAEYEILRPLISQLRHQSATSALLSWFSKFEAPFKVAGLNFSTKIKNSANGKLDLPEPDSESLLRLLLDPAETVLELRFPTDRQLDLTMRTHAGPPTYGTEYSLSSISYESLTMKAPKTSSLAETRAFFCHALTIDILTLIESTTAGDKVEDVDVAKDESATVTWKLIDPHGGQIVLDVSGRVSAILSARVQSGKLAIRFQQKEHSATYLVWDGDTFTRSPAGTREESQQQVLMEILGKLVADQKHNL